MTKYLNTYKKDHIISIKYKKSDNYDDKLDASSVMAELVFNLYLE
jgi:hypothetical protein